MVLNRPRRLWGHTLYRVGTRACSGEHGLVITTQAPENALEDYKKRWETEGLFAAMKRRGFNLEDTHLTAPERVSRLVAVLTVALCWCYKVGVWLDQKNPIPIKKHQRRACSVVRLGLDTLRHLLLNAAAKTTQLQQMIRLLFNTTTIKANRYG